MLQNTPVGYTLTPNPDQEPIIINVIGRVRDGSLSLRKAAAELSNQLDRSVSYEWVRQAVLKGSNDND
jgi:hypothetical protein